MKIVCPKCHIGRIKGERCLRCGYWVSRTEEEHVRTGQLVRLVRNSLIGLVSVLAGVWLIHLF